jgi:hypothetical protein
LKYNKELESRLAEIKRDIMAYKHNKKNAPMRAGDTQRDANILKIIDLHEERKRIYKELGID